MACIYSFFGSTLALAPATFWGPKSPFCYWETMDESGIWFGRAVGVWMTALTTSPWWAGIDKTALAKVYLPCNAIFMLLFTQAAFFLKSTGPAPQNIVPFNM